MCERGGSRCFLEVCANRMPCVVLFANAHQFSMGVGLSSPFSFPCYQLFEEQAGPPVVRLRLRVCLLGLCPLASGLLALLSTSRDGSVAWAELHLTGNPDKSLVALGGRNVGCRSDQAALARAGTFLNCIRKTLHCMQSAQRMYNPKPSRFPPPVLSST